jgi:hypothetical protein
MSRHNIVGSEAFHAERMVSIRSYPRRGRTLGPYLMAGGIGAVLCLVVVGVLAYASQAFGG